MKKPRELERIIKGFANHRRIEILSLLEKKPELSVFDIAEELKIDFRNASHHLNKLVDGGVIIKRSDASSVRHKLTSRGHIILKFVRTLE